MLDGIDDTLAGTAERWLSAFESAVSGSARSETGANDNTLLGNLFHPEGHWRDLVAFTWHITTVSGAENIAAALTRHASGAGASGFAIDRDRAPPRRVTRAGQEVIEVIFRFETATGRGCGVLRLIPDSGDILKAQTLMTALDEIKGHEETTGKRRPRGEVYSRDFRGPNWLDRRKAAAAYEDRDPAVLVVGGGQAGLSIAARLRQLDVDTLIVDRESRIGDNWRNRYHALTLHNQVHVNHLPYMPYPPTWPAYIPKDMIANWFESYAESLELNFWTDTEFTGGTYDEKEDRWTVTLRMADGATRKMRPRHVIMAVGVSGIPHIPEIPTLENFGGKVIHAGEYGDSANLSGSTAIIIGTGTSGHDIAQDLYSNGANATLVQRSPTTVVNVEPSAQLPYALYDEGPSLEDCDLIAASMPMQLMKKAHQLLTARATELDKDLLDGLTKVGFKIDTEDDTGWQFKYLTRGGGYYFNVGCSQLIVDGKVGLIQYDDIDAFVAEGARLRDGTTLPADLVVLATGYKGQEDLMRLLFNSDIAERVGPIWGFGPGPDDQELRNMWIRTDQPGLWFIAGSFAQCRIFSKYLALQIKAREAGMIPAAREAG